MANENGKDDSVSVPALETHLQQIPAPFAITEHTSMANLDPEEQALIRNHRAGKHNKACTTRTIRVQLLNLSSMSLVIGLSSFLLAWLQIGTFSEGPRTCTCTFAEADPPHLPDNQGWLCDDQGHCNMYIETVSCSTLNLVNGERRPCPEGWNKIEESKAFVTGLPDQQTVNALFPNSSHVVLENVEDVMDAIREFAMRKSRCVNETGTGRQLVVYI